MAETDPSKLRIRIPRNQNIKCSDKKFAAMQAKAPPGWEVRRDYTNGQCYYYNPTTQQSEMFIEQIKHINEAGCTGPSCSIQGGSRKTRSHKKRKSKTTKRRK